MSQVKKTRLFQWHMNHDGKMAIFAGYQMPLWYSSGVKNEHLAVLQRAGLFDTSHMASVFVKGDGAFDLLQHCFSRNIDYLDKGKCVYGVFLNRKGFVLDDAILYRFDANAFLVVVNAGMGVEITRHLKRNSGALDVFVSDWTDALCKVDIQGPFSAKILGMILVDPETVFQDMGYFSFKGGFHDSLPEHLSVYSKDDARLMVSRTGYTGEFGFEIFVKPDQCVALWDMLVQAGQKYDMVCCGLAARDSLRGGAMLPLSHTDIGSWLFINTPWDFALPFNDEKSGFSKIFIGSGALMGKTHKQWTFAYTGFDPRKIIVGSDSKVVDSHGDDIGTVLTCVTDMGIGRYNGDIYSIASPGRPDGFHPKGLSCGFMKVKRKLKPGDLVMITDGKRELQVVVTPDIRPDRTAQCSISDVL